MRVSVVGCGYLGAVHAAALASMGHQVVGVDVDPAKVDALSQGRAPFYEPGLPELLDEAIATGRLRFDTDIEAARGSSVHFICVGTPQSDDSYAADLSYVDAAVDALAGVVADGDIVAGKSTVPVGTAARLSKRLAETGAHVHLVWNPEFLREGFAVKDSLRPDRLVYGVPADGEGHPAVVLLDELYASILDAGTPRLVTDLATAELVKVAANSFLATKISFINAMAELCEVTGADVTLLADAIGIDERIGRRFLNAGLGFGGGCLPKDIRAFMAQAERLDAEQAVTFLREVDSINQRRRERMVDLTREVLAPTPVAGARIAVLGAAFKPDSDDVRDSPALDVADRLAARGASVVVTDPQAVPNARRRSPQLEFVYTAEEAVENADAVLLLTEWEDYRGLDPEKLGHLPRQRNIVDGRNALDPAAWRDAGWHYRALGRPASNETDPALPRLPEPVQRLVARWPLLARLVKFGSVGLVAFVVDVSVFNLLLYVGAPPLLEGRPLVAKIISTFLATVVAWLGNRYWTFSQRRSDQPVREFLLFAVSCTVGLGVALVPLWVSHYLLGFTSPLADNIAANVVGLAMGTTFRFIAYSLVVFPSRRARQAESVPDTVVATVADLGPAKPSSQETLPRAASPR